MNETIIQLSDGAFRELYSILLEHNALKIEPVRPLSNGEPVLYFLDLSAVKVLKIG